MNSAPSAPADSLLTGVGVAAAAVTGSGTAASYDAHVRSSLAVTHRHTTYTVAYAVAFATSECENDP